MLENDNDIDYSDVFANLNEQPDDDDEHQLQKDVGSTLIPMELPDGVDCEQTRDDFQTTEKLNAHKLVASFLAVALWAQHGEPFAPGEFCFAESQNGLNASLENDDDDYQLQCKFLASSEAQISSKVPKFIVP